MWKHWEKEHPPLTAASAPPGSGAGRADIDFNQTRGCAARFADPAAPLRSANHSCGWSTPSSPGWSRSRPGSLRASLRCRCGCGWSTPSSLIWGPVLDEILYASIPEYCHGIFKFCKLCGPCGAAAVGRVEHAVIAGLARVSDSDSSRLDMEQDRPATPREEAGPAAPDSPGPAVPDSPAAAPDFPADHGGAAQVHTS